MRRKLSPFVPILASILLVKFGVLLLEKPAFLVGRHLRVASQNSIQFRTLRRYTHRDLDGSYFLTNYGESDGEKESPQQPSGQSRRSFAWTIATSLALLAVATPHEALADDDLDSLVAPQEGQVSKQFSGVKSAVHEEAVACAQIFSNIQRSWPDIEKAGNEAGAIKVLDALSGTFTQDYEISVNSANNLGLNIDGVRIIGVDRPELGVRIGDSIMMVNGVAVERQSEVVELVQEARKAKANLKFAFRRSSESPLVKLDQILRKVYEDTGNPVPEPEEVSVKLRNLRFEANLVKDGVSSLADLRPQIDSLSTDLGKYASA